jgi:hypothetical protein
VCKSATLRVVSHGDTTVLRIGHGTAQFRDQHAFAKAGSRASQANVLEKAENHAAMVNLYFMYYNFARVQTLRVTPAIEAGIADQPSADG